MKKIIILSSLLIACLALLSYGTLAYFSTKDTTKNVITTGNVKIVLHEEIANGQPFPSEGIKGVMPGTAVPKKIYVENTGSATAFVRIKLGIKVKSGNADLNFEENQISLDMNTTDWEYKDGYYYYKKALAKNQKTSTLSNELRLDSALENRFQGAEIQVTVQAHAVQEANNGADPKLAAGWPATP